jgi:catechol 2,3-dioxygenase-like lactoylglutathione lyase family enzyme
MLADNDAVATIAVADLNRARKFYEQTLGLEYVPSPMEKEALTFKSGGTTVLVYRSQYAGTNKATAATWIAGDVDAVVAALEKKGVTFEHYDMPGMTRRGNVYAVGNFKNAWLKDPDGNILAIVSRQSGR